MKKVAVFIVLAVALIVPTIIYAQDPEPAVITPYLGGPDFTVEDGQEVIIRARWGACRGALAQSFRRAGSISLERYQSIGPPILIVAPPSKEYWTRTAEIIPDPPNDPNTYCVIKSSYLWQIEWFYSLGVLAPGTHSYHFVYSTTRRVIDGGDDPDDADSLMDVWPAGYVFVDMDFTITVE